MQVPPTPTPSSAPTFAQVAAALANASGSVTSIAGALVVSMAATLLARAGGVTLSASSSSDVTNTVQESPIILMRGQVRVSGTNRVVGARIVVVPRTSGTMDLLIQYNTNVTNVGGTGSWSIAFRWTGSTAGQFTSALESTAFSANYNDGFFFDSTFNRLCQGGSNDLQLIATVASLALLLRSATSTSGHAGFRLWNNVSARGAAQALVEVGDAASFTRRAAIMGDGVLESPELHFDAVVKTGSFSASIATTYLVNLSGSDITATIPAASAANAGWIIEFDQTAAGTANLILAPASGTIEGAASVTIAGLASAPLRSVRLKSLGVGTGSPGWKVITL